MAVFVIVSILIVIIVIAVAIFLTYKHIQRKKLVKMKKEKIETNVEKDNLEEVCLKALEKPKESLGKLVYSLSYNPELQSLSLFIKSGHDLLAMDPGGKSDPYVKAFLREYPKIKMETKVKKRTLNPIFNEELKFQVLPDELSTQVLIINVFDFDRFSKHDLIGCLIIHLGNLDLSKPLDEWAELEQHNNEEDNEVPLGDVCISLKYLNDEEKLSVTIIEAKNLKKHEEEELHDPYMKILLTESGKKIKKKFTVIKKGTANPYFNEEFTLPLKHDLASVRVA